MKNSRKREEQQVQEFPVWTYEQAEKAAPYINSIMRSIREAYVDSQSRKRFAQRLKDKPGRPNRHTIIQYEDAKREADRLQEQVAEAAQELAYLNIHCVDPINGIGMIPFIKTDQLAWLVFDLFASEKLTEKIKTWRYHHDPLTVRRPLDQIDADSLSNSMIV